jgi:hypothetical protein
MNDRDIRRENRLHAVQTFGREHAADYPANSKAATLLAALDTLLTDLTQAKVGQIRTPVSKETLLDALHLDHLNLARTARAIEVAEPGFAAPYRLPDNPAYAAVLTHADALLTLLEDRPTDTAGQTAAKTALRAKFIEFDMPDDFVADLRADTDALRASFAHQEADNQEGVENTSAIGTLLAQGQTLVTQLDAIMHNKYARQPDLLRAWLSANHVERAPSRAKTPAAPGTDTTP